MGRKRELIPVLDADGTLIEYVEPAVVRRGLREGVVSVVKDDPFTVQLPTGMSRLPRLFWGRGVKHMFSLDKFGQLFNEEQPLWVKVAVEGQVSFEIAAANGHTIPVRVPATGDPVCLTDIADFASLKRCGDLRTLARPRPGPKGTLKPPAIEILTEDQMRDYLSAKATRRGWFTEDGSPDIERAAQPVYTASAQTPARTRVDDTSSPTRELANGQGHDANLGRDGVVRMTEVIHPRVLSLCHEITDPELSPNDRMSEDQVMASIESLTLNEESLQHLLSHGYYKGVKRWAQTELETRVAEE